MKTKKDSNEISVLLALLDFYSDRAVAHASFLVAIVFGLFVILSLRTEVPSLFILYWVIWGSGLYCLLNFGLFASLAEETKNEMISPSKEKGGTIEDVIIRKTLQKWKRTFIRGFFARLKLRPLEKIEKYEGVTILKIGDFLIFVYFLLGFFISLMFFTELSNNILVKIVYTTLWILFLTDLITTISHLIKKAINRFSAILACKPHSPLKPSTCQ